MAIPSLRSMLARWMDRCATARATWPTWPTACMAARRPSSTAGARFTYACLRDRVLRLHAWMQAQGVQGRHRLHLAARNRRTVRNPARDL